MSLYQTLSLFLLIIVFAACGQTSTLAPDSSDIAEHRDLKYFVKTDDSVSIAVAGNEFEITTNNCGSRVSAIERISRSRQFNVILDVQFSNAIRGQLGGDIIVAGAEIEAEIGASLGLQIGSTETASTERQIETPADNIKNVTLQWEEVWQTGQVFIDRADGSRIGGVPFRILTTMRLSQKRVEELACNSSAPPQSTPIALTPDTPSPTNTPNPTFTPTPAPQPPTSTPILPTSTPLPPTLTNTPVPRPPTATPTVSVSGSAILFNNDYICSPVALSNCQCNWPPQPFTDSSSSPMHDDWTLTNNGTADLILESVETTCPDCFVGWYNSSVIQPNNGVQLSADYYWDKDPLRNTGEHKHTITVTHLTQFEI